MGLPAYSRSGDDSDLDGPVVPCPRRETHAFPSIDPRYLGPKLRVLNFNC